MIVNECAPEMLSSIVDEKIISLLSVVRVTFALKVVAPEKVCVLEVVTLAPRSEVLETESDVADVITAFKSNLPVIPIAPTLFVAPTVSEVSLPITKVPVPKANVRSRGVAPSLLSVPLNITVLSVVVSVVAEPNVVAPEYVCVLDVVMALANVAVPDTVSDDVPAEFVIDGEVPFITIEPIVFAPF